MRFKTGSGLAKCLTKVYGKEESSIKQTSALSDSSIETLYAAGYRLYTAGKYEEAYPFFKSLTEIDLFIRKHWVGLGAVCKMKGAHEEAIRAFGMAALIDDCDPYPHLHAAEVFIAINEKIQAQKALESAESVAEKGGDIVALETIRKVRSTLHG